MTPIGLSQNLENGRVMRAIVQDRDLVIWRGAIGALSAWDNRCPHRGMRLSFGFVRGDRLACIYHGWHYDGQGKCKLIPAHPDLAPPETIACEKHQILEKDGVLWVSLAGETGEPVDLSGFEPIRTLCFDCGLQALVAAFENQCPNEMEPGRYSRTVGPDPKTRIGFVSECGTRGIVILFNVVGDQSVNAHLLVCGEWSAAEKIKLSRWCESIRRRAEAMDADGGVAQ